MLRYTIVALALYATCAGAEEAKSPFMEVHDRVWPTYAARIFCMMNPDECVVKGGFDRIELTHEKWQQLDFVHQAVNASLIPMSDQDQYEMAEWWALPKNGAGDCEDYAILKRHLLIAMGWPSSAVLLTRVTNIVSGQGHAVLTVRTTIGDIVLDNLRSDIPFWHELPYRYDSRQAIDDPQEWHLLWGPPAGIRFSYSFK